MTGKSTASDLMTYHARELYRLLLELHWQEPERYEWVGIYIQHLVDFMGRIERNQELDEVIPF